MREEVVIPFHSMEDVPNVLIRYKEESSGVISAFLEVVTRIFWGEYPIETDIDIIDSIGLSPWKGHVLAADSTVVEMRTVLLDL